MTGKTLLIQSLTSKRTMIRLLSFFILSVFLSHAMGQSNDSLIGSGYTSLTVHLSGNYPTDEQFSMATYSNPLMSGKPFEFDKVNDSTYVFSAFTFGPTRIYFYYQNRYYTSILLPNRGDKLDIYHSDTTHYDMVYRGHFKEIYDESVAVHKSLQAYFLTGIGSKQDSLSHAMRQSYKSADQYRDSMIMLNKQRVSSILNNNDYPNSPIMRRFFRLFEDEIFKSNTLLAGYERNIERHNLFIGLDSATAQTQLPERQKSYYDKIIDSTYTDTSSLVFYSYFFLENIRHDPTLKLPKLQDVTVVEFQERLQKTFTSKHFQEPNLFFDMLIAGAYIEQINRGIRLSNAQIYEVLNYFQNPQITDYILYRNEPIDRNSNSGSAYYLPFKQEKKEVFSAIISKYRGKVVIVDFWATWCGPCLVALDKMKKLREKYRDDKDVIFVYITDETSNHEGWIEYVKILGGEHYYLLRAQNADIAKLYQIESLPSYLIIDSNGKISKALPGFVGDVNDIATEVEKTLNR